jgi:hypothetical protein
MEVLVGLSNFKITGQAASANENCLSGVNIQ